MCSFSGVHGSKLKITWRYGWEPRTVWQNSGGLHFHLNLHPALALATLRAGTTKAKAVGTTIRTNPPQPLHQDHPVTLHLPPEVFTLWRKLRRFAKLTLNLPHSANNQRLQMHSIIFSFSSTFYFLWNCQNLYNIYVINIIYKNI